VDAVDLTINPDVVRPCQRLGMVDSTADRENWEKLTADAYARYVQPVHDKMVANGFHPPPVPTPAPPDWVPYLKEHTVEKGGDTLLLGADKTVGEAYECHAKPVPATPAPTAAPTPHRPKVTKAPPRR
jgi:hypothetical protein